MRKVLYKFYEDVTEDSRRFSESDLLIIIQSGLEFKGFVRAVDLSTGFTSSFEFVRLYWNDKSKRVRGISGFSIYDEDEGKYIEGSCAVSSFKENNQSLLLFSDNRHGSKYQKQILAQKLIHLENDTITVVDKVIYISNILNTGIYAYKYITTTQAKEIHKKLQQHYHPDRNNGTTTELFQEIQDTFDWLNH